MLANEAIVDDERGHARRLVEVKGIVNARQCAAHWPEVVCDQDAPPRKLFDCHESRMEPWVVSS